MPAYVLSRWYQVAPTRYQRLTKVVAARTGNPMAVVPVATVLPLYQRSEAPALVPMVMEYSAALPVQANEVDVEESRVPSGGFVSEAAGATEYV